VTRNTELVEKLPWVHKLKKARECDGYKVMPLKVMYGRHASEEEREKYRCTRRAWWTFKALKNSYAKDGNYCWSHLIYRGVYSCMEEETRTVCYLNKLGIQELENHANATSSGNEEATEAPGRHAPPAS
jgi:hypothetical protein